MRDLGDTTYVNRTTSAPDRLFVVRGFQPFQLFFHVQREEEVPRELSGSKEIIGGYSID